MHINEWDFNRFKNFESFIESNYKKIVNLNYIISLTNPNIIQNLTNFCVEKTLKTLRVFR